MADNQGKKYSPEQIRQRDLINQLVERATGKQISDVTNYDIPEKKAYYYRHVTKIPLKPDFISFIKSQFGVDLEKELRHDLQEETALLRSELDKARKKIESLQGEIIDLLKKYGKL